MIWRNALKYPVLIIGIILFVIFLNQESTKKWWNQEVKRSRIPSTCDAVLDRVKPKAPKNWSLECPGTQLLVVNIEFDKTEKSHKEQRIVMYKEIANNFSRLAHFSNTETLEYLKYVKLVLKHKNLEITSMTDGQAVAKFVKLKRQEDILQHLKLTVKVSEKTP